MSEPLFVEKFGENAAEYALLRMGVEEQYRESVRATFVPTMRDNISRVLKHAAENAERPQTAHMVSDERWRKFRETLCPGAAFGLHDHSSTCHMCEHDDNT